MKKSSPLGTLLMLLIISIPLIYTGSVYSGLPQTIPIHFDMNGKPNGYGDKNMLWFLVLFLSALSAGMYLLIKNLPKIDPKKTAGQSPELYNKIAIILVIFLCALNIAIVYASVNGSFNMNNILLPLLGLLFLVLGNYMHSIKPNYFVGFRLPWTLENEDNWRKTHQLVGKLWVAGGLAITISTLLLPANIGFIFFGAIMLIITIIPIVFSYRYFKKNQTNN
jgi:uncharacterized membrane protein